MTVQQYQHHAEQMEAARAEFVKFWCIYSNQNSFLRSIGEPSRIEAEQIAWRAFLTAKGLTK